MPLNLTAGTVTWTAVPGATGYTIMRNGKPLTSTRTATKATGVPIASGDLIEVFAKPSGERQAAVVTWAAPAAPVPVPPVAASGIVKGLWDGNGFVDFAMEADTGFNTLFTGDTSLIPKMRQFGVKACMQSGHWRPEDNTYSVDLATAIAWAKPFYDAGLLRQLYLADEPDPVQWPTSPQVIKQRYDGFKAAFPDVEMVMGFWDGGDGSHIRPFHDAGCFDAGTLDIYPVNNGTYDAQAIPAVASACDKLGVRYYGVAQIFGAEQWQLPSVAQMNRLFDQWEATHQAGMFAYAWGDSDGTTALSGQFQSHPDLVACVKGRLAALTVK